MDNVTQDIVEAIDMEDVADSALDEIQPGKIVQGEVVTIDSEFVYVNVGTKSDGRIPLEEFEKKPEVSEIIDVMLQNKRLIDGMYQFSKKAAETEKRWAEFLNSSNKGNNIITGNILNATNKGKMINCNGITAFLPFSLTADLKNKGASKEDYSFIIKSIDKRKRSIIVSRKDLLDEENKAKWENFTTKCKVGDIVKGEVVKFVEFGAFIRIEGLDGLLHRNDMSWKKVFKQRKILKLGEQKDFIILDINKEDGKISLGLKQLTEDPWLTIDKKYNINDKVSGIIVTLTNYGAFVEVDDGIEGFVSNSDLSWTKNNVNVKDVLKKGEKADFVILGINKDEKKLSLGYKQLFPNPWNTIDERFHIGSTYKKRIKKIVKFGMFVELEEDIDGLVHISDISWDENSKDISSKYKVGDEVDFKILDVNKEEMKISCGIKQLSKSPWELISEKYTPRSRFDGIISGITPFGLFVKFEDDVEGLVHISEVSRKRVENLEENFKIGDKVSTIVLGVDIDKKRLSLSIKNFEMMSEKEELDKIMKSTKPSTVTLGDIVNIKLGE